MFRPTVRQYFYFYLQKNFYMIALVVTNNDHTLIVNKNPYYSNLQEILSFMT